MEQRFEGNPRAEIRLQGRRVFRTDVTHDWGLQLVWEISRNNQVVATINARTSDTYEHPDKTPGNYQVILKMWRYVDYRKNAQGEYLNSRYIDVSNKISYTI